MTEPSPENPLLNRRPPEMAESASPVPAPTPAAPVSAPASVAAAPQTTKAPQQPAPNAMTQIIDTLESVIIALVLALAFRAFVVEAFVIPTGSMAPTLLGANVRVTCPKCGLDWAENVNTQHRYRMGVGEVAVNRDAPLDNSIMSPEDRVCPNCGEHINVSQLPGNPRTILDTDRRSRTQRQVTLPHVNNGDRILVLKYLYDFIEPQRWDVVVFKEPVTATDNYIKRLIGRPNEKIEIIDGDIFVNDLVARKPEHVQEVLWQLVYDNDHFPIDAGKYRDNGPVFVSPWRPDQSAQWDVNGPIISYKGSSQSTLQFEPGEYYLKTRRGYNSPADERELHIELVPVGDVRLEATWLPGDSGESASVTLGAVGNRFRATLNLQDGIVTLSRYNQLNKDYEYVAKARMATTSQHAYRIAMQNVDRCITLTIDGKEVIRHETTWTARDAREYATRPNAGYEKPMVQVELSSAGRISHLKLQRDTYYTQMHLGLDPEVGLMGSPITLGPDEFFVLGDNSNVSGDSRAFRAVHGSLQDLHTRRGVVPRRFLLGKAFFVYWPAGFRPFNGAAPGALQNFDMPLVPNAGEMRFIR